MNVFRCTILMLCVGSASALPVSSPSPCQAAEKGAAVDSIAASTPGTALLAALAKADWRATPEVRSAYLAFAKAQALAELATAGDSLPNEFLNWVDGDPVVASSVYGVKSSPANVLRILRSLELDLGTDVVRDEYKQVALAMAVSNADQRNQKPLGVDLKPRERMILVIPTSPLKPVDTKDPHRELDVNDHIINFLGSELVQEKISIKPKKKGAKPIVETRKRPMTGAHVLADKSLQEKFNAYMAEHGQNLRIDCSRPGFASKDQDKTLQSAQIFHDAYVAKGLLPAKRDPLPTLAESMAWQVRNDRFRFPEEDKRAWPLFPLDAPWPMLTFLAQTRQPLRELEDMWQTYVETGRPLRGGVKYVGKIAHRPPLLRANSIAPFGFYYGSAQMNIKDGGVCGAQSKTWAWSQLALGIPATTASSPTHCGMASYQYNKKQGTFHFSGGGRTTPVPWVFKNPAAGNTPMIHHNSTVHGVNFGLQSFLDSFLVHRLYGQLSEEDRQSHGLALLESGLETNPYNLLLLTAVGRNYPVDEASQMLKKLENRIASMVEGKPGCPAKVLLLPTLLNRLKADAG